MRYGVAKVCAFSWLQEVFSKVTGRGILDTLGPTLILICMYMHVYGGGVNSNYCYKA